MSLIALSEGSTTDKGNKNCASIYGLCFPPNYDVNQVNGQIEIEAAVNIKSIQVCMN